VSSESENFGDDLSAVESGSNWGLVSLDAPTPKDLLKDEGPALETKGTSPLFSKTVALTLVQTTLIVYSFHDGQLSGKMHHLFDRAVRRSSGHLSL
jgi:hypothetical protein